MRGRCAALGTADLTWASLNTLHEHTIINQFQPSRRTKSDMNSIPMLQPLQPVTGPTKAAGDISARFGCRAGMRKDQQNIGMQNEFASVVSSSSTGAALRLCHEATDIVGPKLMFD